MEYISANNFPLEKTLEYIFSSKDFVQPYIVSDDHIPSNSFFYNIMSAWYRRENGIAVNRISPCVFFLVHIFTVQY